MAVTLVVETVTVPATSVATPIVQLEPSLIRKPCPAVGNDTPVEFAKTVENTGVPVPALVKTCPVEPCAVTFIAPAAA